jgi:sodium transport system permease protein
MMTGLRQAAMVMRKELTDGLRDRRSLYVIVFTSCFGPIMVGFMMSQIADRQRTADEVKIPVVGMEHAPALVEWLRQQSGVELVAGPADFEAAVRDKKEDVVVVIADDFIKKFRASQPAPVKLVSDGSRPASRPKVQRVRALLNRYSSEIGILRLVSRGVSPAIATAVQVQDVEVSSAQQRAATILNFLPMFIIMAAFAGGMQIATDSTAGERERGSLEALLVNPAPRGAIAAGKWLAATTMSLASVCLTMGLCVAMMRYIPLQELGMRFRLGPPEVLGLFAAAWPLCPLAAALQMSVSTFARSFKEAQSYMGFLMIIPVFPTVINTMNPITSKVWMYAIPMFSQSVGLTDVLGGKAPAPMMLALAALMTVGTALLLTLFTTSLLHREKIIFGR